MGYGIGKARIEVEIGYEKFELKRDNGKNKIAESDAVYLLAKELAYDVMHNRTRKLARALEHVPGIDIVAFAAALKSWNPDVDRKVCNAVLEGGINNMGYCVPRKVRDDYDRIWGAIERGQPQRNKTVIDEQDVEGSRRLVIIQPMNMGKWIESFKEYWENWRDLERIRGSYQKNGFSTLYSNVASAMHWPMRGYSSNRKDAAAIEEGVVNALTQEEKAEVAKILMRIVEGAEVVKIRAITANIQ